MNYINIDEDMDLNKYANSSKKNDDIKDLLIGSAYLDDLNGERYMDSYFQIPFKERLKKREEEELNKKVIKCTKRKIIYPKDSEQVRDKSVDIKKKKKYHK